MGECRPLDKNNKLFLQSSELCSIIALNKLKTNLTFDSEFKEQSNIKYTFNNSNLFNDNDNDNYLLNLNRNYRDKKNNDYIYQYDKNKTDLCYHISENQWNINCVINNKNPLYTYNNKEKKCDIIPNLKLPQGFKYGKEKNNQYIYLDLNEDDVPTYAFKNKTAFCENKWFNWITVPNYHFGNGFEKDVGIYSKENVRKCYTPCPKGYLPYLTNDNKYICISKNEANDGIYEKKLDFSPISLINIIGNSKYSLIILYYFLSKTNYDNYENDNTSLIKNDNNINIRKFNYIYQNNENSEINLALAAIKETIIKNIVDKVNIKITNHSINTKVITYKNPYFNENDPELITFRGMANYDMLSEPILIHTYLLAKNYSEFINGYLFNNDNYFKEENGNKKLVFDNILNHPFNIKFNLLNIFNNNEINDLYIQRLANILYKAINICYDGKSDFSKNILIYTQNAIDNNINFNKDNKNEFDKYPEIFKLNINDNYKLYNKLENGFKAIPIEIPFIEPETKDKLYISNYVISKLNVTKEEETRINDFYNRNNDINVFFFTQELGEKNNGCIEGEINDNGICKKCNEVCKIEDNSCNNNKSCNLFCEDECIKKEDEKGFFKCGSTKEEKKIQEENKKKLYDTPIDESYNIPNFTELFKGSIKLFFALIILYMCYVFYQIYGETITTLINMFIFYLYNFVDWLVIFIKSKIKGNYNEYEHYYNMTDFIRSNAKSNFEKVDNKIKNLTS